MFDILPEEIIDNILIISGDNNLINNFGSKYIKFKWYIYNIKNKISKLLNDKIIRYYIGMHEDYCYYYVTNNDTYITLIKDEFPQSVYIYRYSGINQYSYYLAWDGRKWPHNNKIQIHDNLMRERDILFEEIREIR